MPMANASKTCYVYIMANKKRMIYTGITNDLERRVYQHQHRLMPGFTSKYNLVRLVYCECTGDVLSAISREKQIKGWLRSKKTALIESVNPDWHDLSLDWDEGKEPSPPEVNRQSSALSF